MPLDLFSDEAGELLERLYRSTEETPRPDTNHPPNPYEDDGPRTSVLDSGEGLEDQQSDSQPVKRYYRGVSFEVVDNEIEVTADSHTNRWAATYLRLQSVDDPLGELQAGQSKNPHFYGKYVAGMKPGDRNPRPGSRCSECRGRTRRRCILPTLSGETIMANVEGWPIVGSRPASCSFCVAVNGRCEFELWNVEREVDGRTEIKAVRPPADYINSSRREPTA